MSNSIRFACTSLAGVNKVGNLKKDENGYYEMVLGALNVFNSAGQFYVFEEAKALFQSSSQLMRRVNRGALRGEYGHPKMVPGMTPEQFANRVLSIYEENVCVHIKEVTLDYDRIKDENGQPVIAIIGKVCPSGPNGPALEKSLENKDENVCFSIRSFTDDYRDGRVVKRVLRTIVTWDYVNEPGISVAEKFKSPALESMGDEFEFSRGQMERAIKVPGLAGIGQESVILTAEELFTSMGWKQSSLAKPSWTKW